MTKEKLLSNQVLSKQGHLCVYLDDLNEFFDSNVVIHKGENRHPYADIIHQKLEDMSLNLEVKQDKARYAGWVTYIGLDFMEDEYRIKPSEPVYEWQWEFTYNGLICRTGFYTYEQIKAYMYNIKVTKIEETKRERK